MKEQSFMDHFFVVIAHRLSGDSKVNRLFSFCFFRNQGVCFTFPGAKTYVSFTRNVRFRHEKRMFSLRET